MQKYFKTLSAGTVHLNWFKDSSLQIQDYNTIFPLERGLLEKTSAQKRPNCHLSHHHISAVFCMQLHNLKMLSAKLLYFWLILLVQRLGFKGVIIKLVGSIVLIEDTQYLLHVVRFDNPGKQKTSHFSSNNLNTFIFLIRPSNTVPCFQAPPLQ